MSSNKLNYDKEVIYTINGTEDTNKILFLCKQMENGTPVKIGSKDYYFCELPEFLATVNNMCQIKLADIYNHYEKVIQHIWRVGIEQSGDKIENYIKTRILKSK